MTALHTSRCHFPPSEPGRGGALVPMPLTILSTGLSAAKLQVACLQAAPRLCRAVTAASSLLHGGMLHNAEQSIVWAILQQQLSIAGMCAALGGHNEVPCVCRQGLHRDREEGL